MLATEMNRIMQEYRRLRAVVPLGSIRTKKEYERAVGLLDAILDEIGEDEKHPMAELADAIGVFVERYESEHSPIPAGKPAEVLRFLMAEHGLRQSDIRGHRVAGCHFRTSGRKAANSIRRQIQNTVCANRISRTSGRRAVVSELLRRNVGNSIRAESENWRRRSRCFTGRRSG